jgi:predicted transglutaminase-like cysteine proteinase
MSYLRIAVLVLLLAPVSAHASSVFETGLPGSRGFAFFPFWQQVLNDTAPAQPAPAPMRIDLTQGCTNERSCAPPVWLAFLDSIRKQPRRSQLSAVNQWANAKPYVEDYINWKVPDYWETPGEFVAHGGDCEDYAIIKYFSLMRLGFSPDDVRIVVVNDTSLNVFHAVLAVRSEGIVWLLDNQLAQPVPMDIAVQYVPVYSLNERGWWIHSIPKISIGNMTISAGKQSYLELASGR